MTPAAAAPAPPMPRWLMPALLSLALLLRLPGLGESLWLDEVFCSRVKIGTPLELAKTLLSDYHPPCYFVLMYAWIGVFGDGELSLRAVPLLSGVLAIAVTARIGRRILGPREGFAAALLMTLSPTHIWYSQEARPYATTMLLVACAALAWFRLDDPDLAPPARRRWSIAYALALGAAVFSHWFVLAFLAAFLVLPWLCGHAARRRLTWIGAGWAAALLAFLLLKSRLGEVKTGSGYLGPFGAGEAWSLLTDWLATGHAFTPRGEAHAIGRVVALLVALLLALLLVLGAARLLREPRLRRSGLALLGMTLCLPLMLAAMTVAGFDRSYIERSALPVLPFFALVVAAGLGAPRPRALRRALAALALGAMLGALAASIQHRGRWTVYKPNPDWRGLAAWLAPRLDRLDAPAVLFSTDDAAYPLSYYEPRAQLAKRFVPADAKLTALTAGIERALGEDGIGGALATRVRAAFAAHRREIAALRGQTRLLIHTLDASVCEAATEATPGTVVWVLDVQGEGDRETLGRMLADPTFAPLEEASFRMLRIHGLQRR